MLASAVEAAPHHKEHPLSHSVSRQTTNHVPEPVARVVDLMSTFAPPWALCGGWAVDAWLGRQSRDHPDVDISVFADDQRVVFDHLAGWQLVAHDLNKTHQPWDGRHLDLPNHIQAHLDVEELVAGRVDGAPEEGLILDIQLDERQDADWILRREPRISLPLVDCRRQSSWGAPTVVPEALLFYKATAYFGVEEFKGRRAQDEPDFVALLARLTKRQRDWLREAISLVHPGHPWLAHVSP